jgi:hypothetical protein
MSIMHIQKTHTLIIKQKKVVRSHGFFVSGRALCFAALILVLCGIPLHARTHARQAERLPRMIASAASQATDITIDLTAYGATGDGVTDDGPALQSALDALWDAGGGTLFVPPGNYAIKTGVSKDFTGRAARIVIHGEPSTNPPGFVGDGSGLNLSAEFIIAIGETDDALRLTGLDALLIEDIAFSGVQAAATDARITLNLSDIQDAAIHRCEFYGLASLVEGGALIEASNSYLNIDGAAFLGCTTSSSLQTSLVQNILWKGVSVSNTKFIDYGHRPEFFSKTVIAPPYSWISISTPAPRNNLSTRREALIHHVILDEGALMGVTCLPTTPVDLLFISDLQMNVSNLGAFGVYVDNVKDLLIESSHFGWSQNAGAAILLGTVDEAILSNIECVAGADRISASQSTRQLTVINSIYKYLDSSAHNTTVLTTTPDDDPLLYLTQQYVAVAERLPDPAAQMYWTSRLSACGNDEGCLVPLKAKLFDYLKNAPPANFNIAGHVIDSEGAGIEGVALSLNGLQTVWTTQTDAEGNFFFAGLPTSGGYAVTPSQLFFAYTPSNISFELVSGDQTANFYALEVHSISGRITQSNGPSINGVTVLLTGSQNGTAVTDSNGDYSFANLSSSGTYTVTPNRNGYTYQQPSQTFHGLTGNQTADFIETIGINGRIVDENGEGLSGVNVILGGSANLSTTTDALGNYSFPDLAEFNGYTYTVVPLKPNYNFSPQAQTITHMDAGSKTLNFTAIPRTYSISGKVTEVLSALGGLTVKLSGSTARTTTTNENGEYVFNDLNAGGSYTVTPTDTPFSSFTSQTFHDLSGDQTYDFAGALKHYTISGRVLDGQTGLAGTTVALTSNQLVRTTLTDTNGNYSFADVTARGSYAVNAAKSYYTFNPTGLSFNNLGADRKADFAALQDARLLVFSAPDYSASEGAGSFALNITRSGDPSSTATVDYRTSDGTASQRTDYTIVSGSLTFAPGETGKTFSVSLIDNAFVDGSRTVRLTLSNPIGASLGPQGEAILTIMDNDTAQPTINPIDGAQMFVRQQYLDFLNREPDAGGLRYWSGQIAQCGSDVQCIHDKRVAVADAFFFEPEFQQTGAYVYRIYKAAFGLKPAYAQFMSDRGRIISGSGLNQSKSAFALTFVQRDEFTSKYPRSLLADGFVDALLGTIKQNSNVDLSSQRNTLLGLYDGTDNGRAAILRLLSDSQPFIDAEYNNSFVLMGYFGYLRRDPEPGGFAFWLGQVNKFPLRDVGIQHAMACSFITSAEYQTRFSTVLTSTNQMCPSP